MIHDCGSGFLIDIVIDLFASAVAKLVLAANCTLLSYFMFTENFSDFQIGILVPRLTTPLQRE